MSDRETDNLNCLKEYENQIIETTDRHIISVLFDEMTRLREQNNFVGCVLNSYKNIAELLSTIIASIESQIMRNAYSEREKERLLTWLNIDNINIDDYKSLETFLTKFYNMICGLYEFINTDETDKEDTLCLIQERKRK